MVEGSGSRSSTTPLIEDWLGMTNWRSWSGDLLHQWLGGPGRRLSLLTEGKSERKGMWQPHQTAGIADRDMALSELLDGVTLSLGD
jgi:hypothetical protein